MSDASCPPAIAAYLREQGFGSAPLQALTGDASDRRYFRVRPHTGPSFVLALHAASFAPATLPFLNVADLFRALGVRIPRVLGHVGQTGLLVLEDLGDVTLQTHLPSVGEAERQRLYERAVDLIVRLQVEGRLENPAGFVPYTLAFDVEKLLWEMRFFLTHFLEAFRERILSRADRAILEVELTALATELAGEPRVLCHRDYHSRNLMVHRGELVVIDFQDARMGPDTYDLASLLRDSYVDLPAAMVDGLIARFAAAVGHDDLGAFRERFDTMALQRNLKALGTFGFQATSRANPAYAQYVPRTLGYVRDNLARHPRFGRLRTVLAAHLPELA